MTLHSMARDLGTVLKQRSETVAISESSTGGLVCAALLSVPGCTGNKSNDSAGDADTTGTTDDEHGHEHLGIPIKFRKEPGVVRVTAPAHGGHTSQILTKLGRSGSEIARLQSEGVV